MSLKSALSRSVESCLEAQSTYKRLNAFVRVASAEQQRATGSGPLAGTLLAVKDNICTEDLPTTCGSPGLSRYISPFDATVVELLRQQGATICGKTNLDEFGMGSHSLYSAAGPTTQERKGMSAGGSSGGSAVAVATDQCHAALGTDTGGSVRLPAGFNGIYGFKPSYGLISRWGVVAYANSLDTVGLMSKNLALLRLLFTLSCQTDARDPSCLTKNSRQRIAARQRDPKKPFRIGIPAEYNVAELAKPVREAWCKTIGHLEEKGAHIVDISLPRTKDSLSAYYILSPAEAASNLAKYDGVRYGSHEGNPSSSESQLYVDFRSAGFGKEVQRRILLGTYNLSATSFDNYFLKAQKVRRTVQEDFNRVFSLSHPLRNGYKLSSEGVDAILCPTSTTLPPLVKDEKQLDGVDLVDEYAGDVFTVPASLAGLPSLCVPAGESADAPVGLQIIAQYGHDDVAFDVAELLQM